MPYASACTRRHLGFSITQALPHTTLRRSWEILFANEVIHVVKSNFTQNISHLSLRHWTCPVTPAVASDWSTTRHVQDSTFTCGWRIWITLSSSPHQTCELYSTLYNICSHGQTLCTYSVIRAAEDQSKRSIHTRDSTIMHRQAPTVDPYIIGDISGRSLDRIDLRDRPHQR